MHDKQQMMHLEQRTGRARLHMRVVRMGTDLCVTVSGGDKEHIGAVALGIPRPSLRDTAQISATVSVLAIPGHKEDELARTVARNMASALNATVCVSCGIHLDRARTQEIRDIERSVMDMTNEMIRRLSEAKHTL